MDYLTFMWTCKYSYVVSCFHLTKMYCVETSIKGLIIVVADKLNSLTVC